MCCSLDMSVSPDHGGIKRKIKNYIKKIILTVPLTGLIINWF